MTHCAENEPFALQVTDDSMAPEFPAGCVIVVEPGNAAEDRQYVIFRDGDELCLRQLLITNAGYCLHALDHRIPDTTAATAPDIVGRVIRRTGRRRRDARNYS